MLLRTWFSELSELGPSPGEESESSPDREILTRSSLSERMDLIVIQLQTSDMETGRLETASTQTGNITTISSLWLSGTNRLEEIKTEKYQNI